MRRVKLSLSLLVLIACAFSLCGCNTLADRRSLYSPKKGEGYWTRTLQEGTWRKRGAKPVNAKTFKRGGAPETTAPVPPPPPPLPPAESAPPAL